MKYNIYTVFLLLFLSLHASANTPIPATEVRAVWLTTNWGLDWPTGKTVESQKADLIKILDQLKDNNFNLVFFQARTQGRVLYNSEVESKSRYYNHSENFDPLAFAIEECHKRGMECHAWLITYPMGRAQFTGKGKRKKVVQNMPSHYKLSNSQWYLDPGDPKSKEHILSLVKEIVSKYDVDGIHFDYIRYPNQNRSFPDDVTFKKYGNGMSLYDWRRKNISTLVAEVYDLTKSMKKWVQVSSSPLGRYRPIASVMANDGWNAYETVFQDAGEWMRSGKHDMLFPMLYHGEKYFYPYLDDWVSNGNGRIVVPGLGIYQMHEKEQNWSLESFVKQMNYTREQKIPGQAYFRAEMIMKNLKGIEDSIKTFYPYPAKLPPLTWLDDKAPDAPTSFQVYKDENDVLHLEWGDEGREETVTYTVYATPVDNVDKESARSILVTGTRYPKFSFPINKGEFGYYYTVTASDRFHNESEPCLSAFFSHSENEQ